MEVEHIVGASKTTGNLRERTHDGQSSGKYTRDNQKAAVIGCSKCTLAQKLEQGTTPDGGTSIQGWGASAAPLPNIPFYAVDKLPPPLMDCGTGKISATKGVDGGERGTDDWIQTTVPGDREQWNKFWTGNEDMTTKKGLHPSKQRVPTTKQC